MSEEQQSLDDLLNDVEPAPEVSEPETAEAGEAATEPEVSEPEAKEEAETPEAKQEEAQSDASEDWTKAAVLDERRKRQEYERKVQELEAKMAEQDAPKRPDVFEDQEGAFSHLQQTFEQRLHESRLELSQEMMRMQHEDYDALESEFIEMAKDNPALIQELQGERNPAKFAYETALKAREAAELKNVDEYKAKLKAEMRAEIEAELKQQQEQAQASQAKKQEALAPSLAASQSKGGVDTYEDVSLEAILDL